MVTDHREQAVVDTGGVRTGSTGGLWNLPMARQVNCGWIIAAGLTA